MFHLLESYFVSGREGVSWGLVDASFQYEYSLSTVSVAAVTATIGDRTLRTLNYNYTSHTGRVNRIQVSLSPRLILFNPLKHTVAIWVQL